MPVRKTVLATNQSYHVFNKSIENITIFKSTNELERATTSLWYYLHKSPQIPFSRYLNLAYKKKINFHNLLVDTSRIVQVICYCLMPNHFHLLVRQLEDNGISKYLANFQNSYAKYFNTSKSRKGSLFLGQFKAVRIETDEQLLHVSRYIHLNPLTGYVVKKEDQLLDYKWSSLEEFLSNNDKPYQVTNPTEIISRFKNSQDYQDFLFNQVAYQRELAHIKHLTHE